MKLLLRASAALVAIMVLTGAAPPCTPLPPKEWNGELRLSTGGWITQTTFEESGCNWNGQESTLNGLDALVWDVEAYAGLPVTVESQGTGIPGSTVNGKFLNTDCEDSAFFGSNLGTPITTVVPPGSKWVVFITNAGSAGVKITMKAGGRTCDEEVEEPEKKKKKKKKH